MIEEIVTQISAKLGLTFIPEQEPEGNVCMANSKEVRRDFKTTFTPADIMDYIYAVLHSPTYRVKCKELLEGDFRGVPYPKNAITFWQLVKSGSEIRQINLLESSLVEKYIIQFPVYGSNLVTKTFFLVPVPLGKALSSSTGGYPELQVNGRVYINESQYFDNVPEIAWNFYIGRYQPAQKWLKDRQGSKLHFYSIMHYQTIIVALMETYRLMLEFDNVDCI